MAQVLIVLLFFAQPAFAETESQIEQWFLNIQNGPVTNQALSKDQLQILFNQASRHPVSDLDNLSKYDPTGEIGFCFGRAMAVQLMARKMGLDPQSIQKLFVIGDLRSGPNPEWRFHVTTLGFGKDNTWYAIDPIMTPPLAHGGPLTMQQWMQIVQKTWDKPKKAYFYKTSGSSILPDVRDSPPPDQETGKGIIELRFDPRKMAAFNEVRTGNLPYFEMTPQAETEYFMQVKEPVSPNSFPFTGLPINGKLYPFNGYFSELLEDLHSRPSSFVARALACESALGKTRNSGNPNRNLHGFVFPY